MRRSLVENLIVAAITTMSILVAPYSVMFVIANSADMYISLIYFLVFLLASAVLFFAVVFGTLVAAGPRHHLLFVNLFCFLIVTATVQYFFLSESMTILDGDNFEPYTPTQLAGDLVLYVAIGGLVYAFRSKIYRNFKLLGAGVCLFQLVNLGVFIHSHEGILHESTVKLANVAEFGSFSPASNVLHVVFDGFQSGLFDDIVQNDAAIASALDGFLYFPDTLTVSEVTQLSFGAFLTGHEYTNIEPMKTYLFNTRIGRVGSASPEQHVPNILEAAAKEGYRVEVATPFKVIRNQDFYSRFLFIRKPYHSELGLREIMQYQVSFVFDLMLFRIAPKWLKGSIYNKGRWILSGIFTPNLGMKYNHHASLQFLEDVTNNFTVLSEASTYKLFHFITPHAPFVTNADCRFSGRELERKYDHIYAQARCGLVKLIRLFDSFRSADIYDSATILIHGDHGLRMPVAGFDVSRDDDKRDVPRSVGNSNPVLLLKPPGHRGDLRTIQSEVSLADVPGTMAALLGLEGDFPGIDFLKEKATNRVRRYYDSTQSRLVAGRDGKFSHWRTYEVTGPLARRSSWRKTGEIKWTKKDIGQFPIKEFLKIEQFGFTDDKNLWIRYRNREPHHFVAVGTEKRPTRFVGKDRITAKLRRRADVESVCIVDMVRELRQCLR